MDCNVLFSRTKGQLMRVIHASSWSMASISGQMAGGERRGRDRATMRAAERREERGAAMSKTQTRSGDG